LKNGERMMMLTEKNDVAAAEGENQILAMRGELEEEVCNRRWKKSARFHFANQVRWRYGASELDLVATMMDGRACSAWCTRKKMACSVWGKTK
jgi:hypothetical protein